MAFSYLSAEENRLLQYHRTLQSDDVHPATSLVARVLNHTTVEERAELQAELDQFREVDPEGAAMLSEYLGFLHLKERIKQKFFSVILEEENPAINHREGYFSCALAGIPDDTVLETIQILGDMNELIKRLPPSVTPTRPRGVFIPTEDMPSPELQREVAIKRSRPEYHGIAVNDEVYEMIEKILGRLSDEHLDVIEYHKLNLYIEDPIEISFEEDEYFPEYDVLILKKGESTYRMFLR